MDFQAEDKRIPFLTVGDAPTTTTGLGRIARDVTELIRRHVPAVRVAQLGLNYDGRRANWHVYPVRDSDSWGQGDIAEVWEDWSPDPAKQGVVMTFWDPGRCPAMVWGLHTAETRGRFEKAQGRAGTQPVVLPWRQTGRVRPHLWGYFAVDAADKRGQLGGPVPEVLGLGYQRALAYAGYGAKVLEETLGRPIPALPHGIDTDVFRPYWGEGEGGGEGDLPADVEESWLGSGWPVIGVVATNTPRKDWGSVFAALEGVDCHLWVHTDQLVAPAWNITELAEQYGRNSAEKLHVTLKLDDAEMARWYSFCDATIAPGLGEGFGYPIVESLACGTPVVHVNYAAGREFIPLPEWRLMVAAERLEGPYALVRPVLQPRDVRETVKAAVRWALEEPELVRDYCRASVAHLDWRRLWPHWHAWINEGLQALAPLEER
jgi:glycosyltransferase involved in cell wall biosynthesis